MPDSKSDELVLCVPSSTVRDLFAGRSWLPSDEATLDTWLASVPKAFLPRSIAETSTEWRHLATYAVLTSGEKVFSYRRGKSGSEGRLHGALSIGVGGHVGLEDYDHPAGFGSETSYTAAFRELYEELDVSFRTSFRLAGLIADDSTSVNAVHLGVVYQLEVDQADVSVREDCLSDPRWMTVDDLIEAAPSLEVWSRIVLDEMLLQAGRPS